MTFLLKYCAAYLLLCCSGATLLSSERNLSTEFALPDNPRALDPSHACGPMCLMMLNRLSGGDETYERICRLCPPGPQGTSLHELKQAAESLGLYTRGVKASLEDLRQVRHYAILHLEQGQRADHFLALLGWSEDEQKAYVFSPPARLAYETLPALRQYSGIALLISNTPFHEPIVVTSRWSIIIPGCLIVSLVLLIGQLRRLLQHGSSSAPAAKSQLLSAMILAALLTGCSRSDRPPSTALRDERRDVDLGRVLTAPEIRHTFVIRNSSAQPCTITEIKKSCSCQAAGIRVGTSIAPGATVSIPYAIPTAGYSGPQTGRLEITTDSAVQTLRHIVLRLRADLQPRIQAIPPQIVFGTVVPGDRPHRTLRIESAIPGLLGKYRSVTSQRGGASIVLQQSMPGALIFNVTLPSTPPVGDFRDTLVLAFDDETTTRLLVEVRAQFAGAFVVIPPIIKLTSVSNEPQLRRIRVKSTTGKTFRIIRVKPVDDMIVGAIPSARQAIFDLSLQVGTPPGSKTSEASVSFETDPPGEASLKILYP